MNLLEATDLTDRQGIKYRNYLPNPQGRRYKGFTVANDAWVDPLEEGYKDSIFNHPFNYSLKFIDPKTELRETHLSETDRHVHIIDDEATYKSGIYIQGYNAALDSVDVIFSLADQSASDSINNDELSNIFKNLTDKAGENLSNGTVKKENLMNLALRDHGLYKGKETLDIYNDMAKTAHASSFEQMTDPVISTLSEQLIKFHQARKKGEDPPIKSIIDNTIKILTPLFKEHGLFDKKEDPQSGDYLYTTAHKMVTSAFMSTMLHGVRLQNFGHAFLTEYEKIRPISISRLLGDDVKKQYDWQINDETGRMSSTSLKFLMKIIRPATPHYATVVKNYYRLNCT
jgi:hypothetical protein